jgi:toxin-antitoxin system, toxin component, bro family
MDNKIIIFEKEIEIKEYNGERVVTAWDIAKIHGRDVNEITKNFNRNRETFDLNEDYFVLNKEEFSERFKIVQDFIPNNVKEIILFTQSGYLLLAKTFSDKLSWKIQKELIKAYFKLKELKDKVESGELEIQQTKNNQKLLSAGELNDITNLIMKFEETESTVTKKMIIETVSAALGGKTKFGYEKPENAVTKIPEGTVTGDIAAEIMIRRYNLKNFTVASMKALASIDNLNIQPLVYLYYNEETFNKRYYYTEAFMRQLIRNIITNKQRAKKYECEYMESIPKTECNLLIELEDF